jgi:hypothetical protein
MADNNYSITEFYKQAAEVDFARLFQFQVEGKLGRTEIKPEHGLYVETASLPGRQINNIPVPYRGLSFNLPGTVSYPGSAGYQVVFRCDEEYDLRALLEGELFETFDESTSSGKYSLPKDDNSLIFKTIDKEAKAKRVYKLFGVYVQAIGDTQYDVKDTGNVATIQATLAYQFWRAGDSNDVNTTTPMKY